MKTGKEIAVLGVRISVCNFVEETNSRQRTVSYLVRGTETFENKFTDLCFCLHNKSTDRRDAA